MTPAMTEFMIEDELDGIYTFTAPDAPERSTGWRDSFSVDMNTGSVEFFDAEANELFPCSPIRDLDLAISRLEDAIEDARYAEMDDDRDNGIEPLTFANTGCRR